MSHNEYYIEAIPPSNKSQKTWDIFAITLTTASGTVLLGSIVTKGAFGAIVSAIIGAGIGIVACLSHNRKYE